MVWEDHLEQVEAGRPPIPEGIDTRVWAKMSLRRTHPPPRLTQRAGPCPSHVVGADVVDPVPRARLGQHHDADVPESVDGDLRRGTVL